MGDDNEAAERRFALLKRWMPLVAAVYFALCALALLLVGISAPKALGFWWVLTTGVLTMFYVGPLRRSARVELGLDRPGYIVGLAWAAVGVQLLVLLSLRWLTQGVG